MFKFESERESESLGSRFSVEGFFFGCVIFGFDQELRGCVRYRVAGFFVGFCFSVSV